MGTSNEPIALPKELEEIQEKTVMIEKNTS